MAALISISLMLYCCWRAVNIYENFKRETKITKSVSLQIISAFFMAYFLVKASIIFLIFLVLHVAFVIFLGLFLHIVPGPEEFEKNRGKVINGYWEYGIIDAVVCLVCFILSLIGNSYV